MMFHNELLNAFLKKGFSEEPRHIVAGENAVLEAQCFCTEYTDEEIELGEAILCYAERLQCRTQELYKELRNLPANYTLHDAALYVLRRIYTDRRGTCSKQNY